MEQLDDPTFNPFDGTAIAAGGYAYVRYAHSVIPANIFNGKS